MSSALSDYNPVNGTISVVSRKVLYADLNTLFFEHPVLKDIKPITDIDAVKNAVKNLVLSSRFDRPFHPELGCRITEMLFENATPFTAISIRQEIEQVLLEHEPRINQVDVEILDDSDRNAYVVNISFNIIADSREAEISFYLNRLR
jgi:phage baseplate assembly protein W